MSIFIFFPFEVRRWGQCWIPLLSWRPSAACPAVSHWPGRSFSGLNGRGDCTLSGSGPCLSPALVHPAVHFPGILLHTVDRECVLFTDLFTINITWLAFLLTYLHNALSELTCCSFIHKVQFIVEVGQFRVLLFHNESYVVEQCHFPVCRLSVQQLCNKWNEWQYQQRHCTNEPCGIFLCCFVRG